jgi:hypothetical protein
MKKLHVQINGFNNTIYTLLQFHFKTKNSIKYMVGK